MAFLNDCHPEISPKLRVRVQLRVFYLWIFDAGQPDSDLSGEDLHQLGRRNAIVSRKWDLISEDYMFVNQLNDVKLKPFLTSSRSRSPGPARHPFSIPFHLSDTTRQKRPTLGDDRAHLVRYQIRRRLRRRSSDTATLTVLMFIISTGSIFKMKMLDRLG